MTDKIKDLFTNKLKDFYKPNKGFCTDKIKDLLQTLAGYGNPTNVHTMLRRVKELMRQPDCKDLRRKVARNLADLQGLYPWLDGFQAWSIDYDVAALQERIDHEAQLARDEAIQEWQKAKGDDPKAQRRWVQLHVKEDASTDLLHDTPDAVLDPAIRVEELVTEWKSVWDRAHPADDDLDQRSALQTRLDPIRRPQIRHTGKVFTAKTLQHSARSCLHRAAGPDDWTADRLLEWPDDWWHQFARLWQRVYDTGLIPARWTEVRMTLIPKSRDAFRVLGIAAAAWRIGTKVIVKNLDAWIN